jgi:hypothetical protein
MGRRLLALDDRAGRGRRVERAGSATFPFPSPTSKSGLGSGTNLAWEVTTGRLDVVIGRGGKRDPVGGERSASVLDGDNDYLNPADLIRPFSDGVDQDGNGYSTMFPGGTSTKATTTRRTTCGRGTARARAMIRPESSRGPSPSAGTAWLMELPGDSVIADRDRSVGTVQGVDEAGTTGFSEATPPPG